MTTNNAIQTIQKDNTAIIDALIKASEVAMKLCEQGFKVLNVTVGNRNPVIHINPSKRCAKLGGASIKRTKGSALTLITMAASIDGVQIEWTIPHHG